MKNKTILVLSSLSVVFIILITLSGCGGSGANSQNYQDPSFASYKIIKIGVFPIRNTNLNIGEANEVNRYFLTGLSRKTNKYSIIGPDECIDILNRDTLIKEYETYLVSYVRTGIPNKDIIKKICKAINVDAIVQGEIFNIIKIDGRYGSNKGETKCSLRYSLISGSDGKLLWETTVDSYETTSTTLSKAPPLMDVVKMAMDKMLESIPTN